MIKLQTESCVIRFACTRKFVLDSFLVVFESHFFLWLWAVNIFRAEEDGKPVLWLVFFKQ